MSQHLINIHSNVSLNGEPKAPISSQIEYGEIAINYNSTKPSIFIKNTDDEIVDFIDSTNIENLINSKITTSLSSESTDTQVPSAKAVYDTITENEEVTATALNDLNIRVNNTLTLDSTQVLTSEQKDNVLRKLNIADERLNLTIECDTPSAVIGVTVIVRYGNVDHSYTYQGPMSITIPVGQNYIIKFSHISGYYAPDSITYESIRNNVRNVTVSYRTTLYSDLSLKDINGLDLLKRNTANCYVIKSTGYYEFPLVYGNAITNGEINTSAYTQIAGSTQPFFNYLNNQISNPFIETDTNTQIASAEVVYSDVSVDDFLITDINIIQRPLCKYLTFKVDKFPTLGGNAIIAIKNGSGNDAQIMWSWHIWAYGGQLSTISHRNTNGKTYEFLDVNLGWVKESQGSKYGTCPFYQWGRKDPMLRAANSSSNTNATVGYGSWSVTTTAPSVAATIQNPNVFNTYETTHYNWWNNNGRAVDFYNYWDASQTTTGNADKTVVKTIYDPCPAGFSIPCGNAFLGFSTGNGGIWDRGWTWDDRYFPAAGYRNYGTGGLSGVGSSGNYWLASSYSQHGAYNLDVNSGEVYPQGTNYRARGFSVCPVRLLELI